MDTSTRANVQLRHPRSFFIGGQWALPSTASTIKVHDSATEEVFVTIAEAQSTDVERAVAAARDAFDRGLWPRLRPQERAVYLGKIADACESRGAMLADAWTVSKAYSLIWKRRRCSLSDRPLPASEKPLTPGARAG